jgi:hypothetical protein
MTSRPTVVRAEIESAIAQYRLSLSEHPVIALGLRAGLTPGGNQVGGFDDALVVVTPELCETFTGNTDPSSETPGRANLITGISWFKPGKHHPGTPKEYDAFVQDGPITVRRWQTEDVPAGTKDARGECLGAGLWRGDFAIHIHDAMGVNTTGSEGCQTVIKTEWPSYHTLLLHELITAGVTRFPYLLVEGIRARPAVRAVA